MASSLLGLVVACSDSASAPPPTPDSAGDASAEAGDAGARADASAPDARPDAPSPGLCVSPALAVRDEMFPGPGLPSPWAARVSAGARLEASGGLKATLEAAQSGGFAFGELETPERATRARVAFEVSATGDRTSTDVGCRIVFGRLAARHVTSFLTLSVRDLLAIVAGSEGAAALSPRIPLPSGSTARVVLTMAKEPLDIYRLTVDVDVGGSVTSHVLSSSHPTPLDRGASIACGVTQALPGPNQTEVVVSRVSADFCP